MAPATMLAKVLLGIVPKVSPGDGVLTGAKQLANRVLYGVGHNAGGIARALRPTWFMCLRDATSLYLRIEGGSLFQVMTQSTLGVYLCVLTRGGLSAGL